MAHTRSKRTCTPPRSPRHINAEPLTSYAQRRSKQSQQYTSSPSPVDRSFVPLAETETGEAWPSYAQKVPKTPPPTSVTSFDVVVESPVTDHESGSTLTPYWKRRSKTPPPSVSSEAPPSSGPASPSPDGKKLQRAKTPPPVSSDAPASPCPASPFRRRRRAKTPPPVSSEAPASPCPAYPSPVGKKAHHSFRPTARARSVPPARDAATTEAWMEMDDMSASIKQCPACGVYIEKIDGDDKMMCGCEAREAGGTLQKALANGGCGHEFTWTTLAPLGFGKPGEPAHHRQKRFAAGTTPHAAWARAFQPNIYPSYWKNSWAKKCFDYWQEVHHDHYWKFDELLWATYAAKVTRDRPCPTGWCAKHSGGCKCVQVYTAEELQDQPSYVMGLPTAYRTRKVIRNEDSEKWAEYTRKRDEIRERRKHDKFRQFRPPIMTQRVVDKYEDIFDPVDKHFNEAYFMHGTSMRGALSIAENNFRIDLAGSSAGTMYGRGVYLAESCTKADEYAKDEPGGDLEGVYALLICRCFMGKLYYTKERKETAEERIAHGTYDSTLGDRKASVGTFREFVAYDKEQIYVEYVVLYHRVHARDSPEWIERHLKDKLDLSRFARSVVGHGVSKAPKSWAWS